MKSLVFGVLAAPGLLWGCISSPPPSQELFTLPTSTPNEEFRSVGSLEGMTLGFCPVSVASHLDRAFVAIRLSETRYEYADSLRWASPVEAIIQERLVEALFWATGASEVESYPWASSNSPDVQVAARLVRFEITDSGSADLAAYWFIRDGQTRELVKSGHFENHQPGEGGSAGAAVRALDRALVAFAVELAEQIR